MTGTNLQVDTLVTDLHDRKVVEKLLASQAGPGRAGPADGRGVRRRRERLAAQDRWRLEDLRPDLPWCGVHQAERDRARHLVRRLPRQHHRLERPLRPADHRGHPAERRRPRPPGGARERVLPGRPRAAAGPQQAARRPRQGPEVAVRLQRHGDRWRGLDHGTRHDPRQPALPLARPLPLHPAAADHPRPVRRGRRQPGRLARREHRLEQGRRLEPHRLDGLPVHAVRVPDAPFLSGQPDLLPDHRGRQGARQARGAGDGAQQRRLAVHGHAEPVPDRRGLRARRPGHVDELDPDELLRAPRRQRRAAAHDRHLPGDGQGHQRARTCWRARTRPAACRG